MASNTSFIKYKILIKYTSKLKKDFYYFYIDEETEKEFVTTDANLLNETVKKLDKIYGHENIRTIADISYNVNVEVFKDSMYEFITEEDVEDIYSKAFNTVFGDKTEEDNTEEDNINDEVKEDNTNEDIVNGEDGTI